MQLTIPDWVPRVVATYTNGFSVATLGQSAEAKAIDWQRLAADLGQLWLVFADVAVKTMWRRMPMGRGHRNCPALSATMTESNGRRCGNLGSHLAEAVVNLVASGLQNQLNRWPSLPGKAVTTRKSKLGTELVVSPWTDNSCMAECQDVTESCW